MHQAFSSTEYIWPDVHRQQAQCHNDLSLPDLYAVGENVRCPHAFTAGNLLKAVTWLHASTIGYASLQQRACTNACIHHALSIILLPFFLHLYLHLDSLAADA